MRAKTELRPDQQRMTTRLYESDAMILIARMGAGKTAVRR